MVSYPSRSEYIDAIRHPQIAFQPQKSLNIETTLIDGAPFMTSPFPGMGSPWLASGNWACVFKYQTSYPKQQWAIRCFLQNHPALLTHYERLPLTLQQSSCAKYFAQCELIKQGIFVNGNVYPILKMEWVEGTSLKTSIQARLGDAPGLYQLATAWAQLVADLHHAGLAHGDLHPGNIRVTNNRSIQLKLIDYDSVYVRQFGPHQKDHIKGLPTYQHPARERLNLQCLEVDHFPALVIYLSILALAEQPELWHRCHADVSDQLLFSEQDFLHPHQSWLFQTLRQGSAQVSYLASILKDCCQSTDLCQTPALSRLIQTSLPSGVLPQTTPSRTTPLSIALPKIRTHTKIETHCMPQSTLWLQNNRNHAPDRSTKAADGYVSDAPSKAQQQVPTPKKVHHPWQQPATVKRSQQIRQQEYNAYGNFVVIFFFFGVALGLLSVHSFVSSSGETDLRDNRSRHLGLKRDPTHIAVKLNVGFG